MGRRAGFDLVSAGSISLDAFFDDDIAVTLNGRETAMGAWGGVIMGFFGAVFAALTMYWRWHVSNIALAAPFIVFVIVGLVAAHVIRLPGIGLVPSAEVERAIMWSSIAEGIGLFLAANIVVNLHRADLLLPSMALIVGLHFLPIAFAAKFGPYYALGAALILSAIIGFALGVTNGAQISGISAAMGLWIAAVLAVRRDWRAKRIAMTRSEA